MARFEIPLDDLVHIGLPVPWDRIRSVEQLGLENVSICWRKDRIVVYQLEGEQLEQLEAASAGV